LVRFQNRGRISNIFFRFRKNKLLITFHFTVRVGPQKWG
jgi:hypothetical protein